MYGLVGDVLSPEYKFVIAAIMSGFIFLALHVPRFIVTYRNYKKTGGQDGFFKWLFSEVDPSGGVHSVCNRNSLLSVVHGVAN